MKIVFLGDSLTWGAYGGNFVELVADKMPEHTIINAGQGGNTVVNLLRRLDEVLAHEPDGVFVMVGGNDAISHHEPGTRPYYKSAQKIRNGFVSPDEFAHTYRELLTQIQLNHVQAWVGLQPTEYSPEIIKVTNQYNQLARDAAGTLNIPVLDLAPHFTPDHAPEHRPIGLPFIFEIGEREKSGWDDYEGERKRRGYTFTFDGLHITPASAERLAGLVVDFLRKQIES